MSIANTPEPPYYAVIFTSVQTEALEGYSEMAERMETLAKRQPGYLGIESARNDIGITVSYWSDLASIKSWKQQAAHLHAQSLGKERWYKNFNVRISRVEKEYGFSGPKKDTLLS